MKEQRKQQNKGKIVVQYEAVRLSIVDINKNGNITIKPNQELIDPFAGNKTRLNETEQR